MVVCAGAALVTGFLAPPWWLDVHVYAGYGLCVLLAFRLVWGFAGSRYSRFDSFVLSVSAARSHLVRSLARDAPGYAGHNPLGVWMAVLLLVLLGALTVSGLIVLGGQEKQGPFAGAIGFQAGHTFKGLHEIAAWTLLVAVVVHVAGVLMEEFVIKRPVLVAMVTGCKAGNGRAGPDAADTVRGAGVFIILAAGLVVGGVFLSTAAEPRALRFPAVFEAECGACHAVYHPSLRSGATWNRLMAGLSDHCGEDVPLDVGAAAEISAFLGANGAERHDTEVAWRIGRVETESLRMTDTYYWKRHHREIPNVVFRWRSVGAKINCNGCHGDAAGGRYADQEISLPEGAPR